MNNKCVCKTTKRKKIWCSDSCFNPFELQMGAKHELEHTQDKDVAKQIAKEHLIEHPDYYSRLKKMFR